MSEYDHGFPMPDWFVDELRLAVTVGPWSRPALVAKANEFKGKRENDWDLTALAKFLNGSRRTIEFATALAKAMDIPAPIVALATRHEAEEVKKALAAARATPTKLRVTKK